MAKTFYTENDIEDLVKRGILTLDLDDNVVLTELAYEKANRLGMKLVRVKSDPAKPVKTATPPMSSTLPEHSTLKPVNSSALAERIRKAVTARMGNQIEPALLDNIIQRVLNSTGLK